MQIPPYLVEEIAEGRVVLCLGAGASVGARKPDGTAPPTGDELRDLLAESFLGGAFKTENLSYVADLAASESSLFAVQDFVADRFRDLQPAAFHALIPSFRWRAIVTTNYDQLIETIYNTAPTQIQEVVPFLSNSDRVEEGLRSRTALPLVKLHGCITRTHDDGLPLILTVDQYNTHKANRTRLFSMFEGWAFEYPVVFVGHRLQDSDLRALISEVSGTGARSRFYLVRPDVTDTEQRFWETRRITCLPGGFGDLLGTLDNLIDRNRRALAVLVERSHAIERRFVAHEAIGVPLLEFLSQDVTYVHDRMPIEQGQPEEFYKGFGLGWYPIAQDLDVRRRLTDTLLTDVIERSDGDRPVLADLYVIRAEAGAGKSVFLRRLAWDAATIADRLCLYAHQESLLDFESISELHRLTKQRVFLFLDDAADNVLKIVDLLERARRQGVPITIVTAERINAWNMHCERLNDYLVDQFSLRYLSRDEIEKLVRLLELHNSLGPNLAHKTFEARVSEFTERAGRQLLVALHEATLGKPYEEILLDEFNEVEPVEAKSLYLTVCVLNRLGVPVRAGLIARVHKIPFEAFRTQLFKPLEHVVHTTENATTRDYYYVARHPEIAQVVFDRVLREPADRYNEYVRIIRELNLLYSTDRSSFRGMLRAKSLHDLFPSYDDARAIFELAREVGPNEAYVFQQMANYERIRPNGNLEEAEKLLTKARDLDPRDNTIAHTLAEVLRARAESADSAEKRALFRNRARKVLAPLLVDPQTRRHAHHTAAKLAVDDLRDLLADPTAGNQALDAMIRAAEKELAWGLQAFPNDEYFLTEEANLSQLIRDDERAFRALQSAFRANARDPYVAGRLARAFEEKGLVSQARDTLHEALQGNRGDKNLNFRYAMLLRKTGEQDSNTLAYHFLRAFTKWDSNHEAQFWYARYAYESQDPQQRGQGSEVFRHLRDVPLPHDLRVEIRDYLGGAGGPGWCSGAVIKIEASFGFVRVDGTGEEIFFHRNNVVPANWNSLRRQSRVRFHIGFSYSGPRAADIEPI